MGVAHEAIDTPLNRDQLIERWQSMCADPTFEDIAGKIELSEWGEIIMSPVGKTDGLLAVRIAQVLEKALSGRAMVEVGIATAFGIRTPDVAWCSEAFLAAHPEEAPLLAAPELCVEIASASNALPKLREKAEAYVGAGAVEAWIVFPVSKRIEIYGSGGQREATSFPIGLAALFA